MFDAVALGEILIDFACTGTDKEGYPVMVAHPGGAPANFLATIQKFGGSTAMIGKVGNDAFGKLLVKTLKSNGINTDSVIESDSVFTTLAFVTFNEENDREFSFARKPGADTCLTASEIDTSVIEDSKVFHFGTLSLTDEPAKSATEAAVAYARNHNKILSFDPNLRKPLWSDLKIAKENILWGLKHADIVKISDEEVDFIFGEIPYRDAINRLLNDFGVKLAYVTLGKKGCIFGNRNGIGEAESLTGIEVKDTTGAGDIFGGSAMWALLQLKKNPEDLDLAELKQIVRFACVSAGLSTTKDGGINSIPDLVLVEKNL